MSSDYFTHSQITCDWNVRQQQTTEFLRVLWAFDGLTRWRSRLNEADRRFVIWSGDRIACPFAELWNFAFSVQTIRALMADGPEENKEKECWEQILCFTGVLVSGSIPSLALSASTLGRPTPLFGAAAETNSPPVQSQHPPKSFTKHQTIIDCWSRR